MRAVEVNFVHETRVSLLLLSYANVPGITGGSHRFIVRHQRHWDNAAVDHQPKQGEMRRGKTSYDAVTHPGLGPVLNTSRRER